MTDESMSYLDALKEIKRLKEALNNIRAEIEALYNTKNYLDGRGVTVLDCLKIIDKYREDE